MLGLPLVALAALGGRVRIVEGVIEAHGPLLQRALATCVPVRGAVALTLGHVVIARDERALETTRGHERVHVRQYERWGPFFLPAYGLASAWAAITGGHYYYDNIFEREAVREEELGR